MTLPEGQTICNGKYEILRLIGEGGQSRVWLAREVKRGLEVGIKEPLPVLSTLEREELEMRFQRELRISGRLLQIDAPNVVRVWTVEGHAGQTLLVMEYCPGGSLAERLKGGPLPIEEAVQITLQLCEALAVLHERLGLVHRDIKPSNVLFTAEGQAKLGDFGLAQTGESKRSGLTGGGHPGTPGYMSPEQEERSGYLTPASDIYSLGCVLFEMLTGEPYQRQRPGTRASALRPQVPDWLDEALGNTVENDAWARLQTARDMAGKLGQGSEAPKAADEPPAMGYHMPRSILRVLALSSLAGGVVLATAAVLALLGRFACVGPLAFLGARPTGTASLSSISTPTRVVAVGTLTPPQTRAANGVATTAAMSADTPTPKPTTAVMLIATRTPAVTLSATSTPLVTLTPASGPVAYVVQAGDSLYRIALRFGVSVEDIVLTNHLGDLGDGYYVRVGQVLVIPVGVPPTRTTRPTMTPTATDAPTPLTPTRAPAVTATLQPNGTTPPVINARAELHSYPRARLPAGRVVFGATQVDSGSGMVLYVMYQGDMMWQQITDNQYTDRDPVWSPEGNRLAFTSYQEFFDYLTDWLIVSSDEGTNQVPVAHGYSASWAPDGAKLVYGTGGGVAVVALPEAKEQVLTTNAAGWSSHPAWSPDGGLIAYVAGRAPAPGGFVDYELFTMRADGSGSQALVTDGSSLHPAWSPVTDEIAFFHRVDGLWGVFLVGADGANLRLIVTLGESIQWWSDLQLSGLAWSPDGEYIAFAADLDKNGHPDINVISRDGREAFRITDNSSFTRMSGLDWQ